MSPQETDGLRYLSLQDTIRLLDPAEVVAIGEETLRAHADDAVMWSDPRIITLSGERLGANFRVKLCAVMSLPAVGFRVTSSVRGRDQLQGGPTRMVLIADPDTGEFRAMVDERWTFALRTGAGAAIAIKHLHGPDTAEVGLIGAGHMARGTLLTLKAALPNLGRVLLTSRTPASRERMAAAMAPELGIDVVPVDSAQLVMAGVDAVVVSTTAREPIIAESWLRPGCTVYSMGHDQELDTESYLRVDKFIADDWGQVRLKSDMVNLMARGVFAESNVYGDLSQILSGRLPGRERPDERIFVRSEGLVSMDVAVSNHLYECAVRTGAGQRIQI